jgi:signal transduction histidine kinase
VTDHGPGIPVEFREKIFEKFAQVDGEKRKYGTGLGLTFCKLAVEAHGGAIGVESDPEAGNSFWFTLPLAQ